MKDYRFIQSSQVSTPGRVVIVAKNSGQVAHNLSVVPLPEDLPPILEQLRGTQRRLVSALASTPSYRPGLTGAVAVDLRPGRYALVCFLTDPDGKSHASKGMASEFRIR